MKSGQYFSILGIPLLVECFDFVKTQHVYQHLLFGCCTEEPSNNTAELLLNDTMNKGRHRNHLPTKDMF